MTEGILTVFGILAGAVALFASGRVRPDVVAILVVLALNLSGVLTIQEAVAGFGQPVVVLLAAVSIVGEGLIATGVAYRLGEAVMKAGGSNEVRLMALVMMLAGTVGAFMSSSAIVAMFIPVVLAIANKTGLNRKRMLMPLSIAALISGMMTLIASSPNMIVEDTLRARGLAPLSFFSWTPFGVAVLAAAIIFMMAAGRNMLSKQTSGEEAGVRLPSAYDLLGSYGLADKWHRLQVPRGSPLIGQPAAQVPIRDRYGIVLVGFEKHQRGREQFMPATPETIFEPDDAIFAVGNEEQTQQLIAAHNLVVLPRLDPRQRHEALQEVGVAEIMLAPEAKLIGRTLHDLPFAPRYDLNVLAIRHRGEKLTTQLEDQNSGFWRHPAGRGRVGGNPTAAGRARGFCCADIAGGIQRADACPPSRAGCGGDSCGHGRRDGFAIGGECGGGADRRIGDDRHPLCQARTRSIASSTGRRWCWWPGPCRLRRH